MNKRLKKLVGSGFWICAALLAIFAAVSAFFSIEVALIEGAVAVFTICIYTVRSRSRSKAFEKYIEDLSFQVNNTEKSSMANFPLPMIIARLDTDEIVWCNQLFTRISDMSDTIFSVHIKDALPGFETKWLLEGKTVCPFDLEMSGRKYNVYGNIVRSSDRGERSLLSTLFFVDITDYSNLRDVSEKRRPVVAVISIDSYDELIKDMKDSELSALSASIDKVVSDWAEPSMGILRKLNQNRYLFIFEQKDLIRYTAEKFPLLETVKEVKNSAGVTASLSIGIGKGELSLQELYSNANISLEMALSRGGDQVVIKSQKSFDFFGGRSKEVEKRTKVKSRVVANAMRQLINDSSYVFITGHKFSDMDSIGADVGICAAVRACGKNPYLLVDTQTSSARDFIKKISELPEYKDVFVTEDEAMVMADGSSLLIVADTSRPELVECPSILSSVNRIMVIDHHRRAASYIENPALSMIETSASSASELVTELLQYIITPKDLLKQEAEGLLAGMYLDTKNFSVHTGVRTFEAAAYLKQVGADTIEVKRFFAEDLGSYVLKSQIMASAVHALPGIAVSVWHDKVDRAIAGQAADELMNASRTNASFVIFGEGDGCAVSARSYGQLNVQVIMEKIGGGGSMTQAGAQFQEKTPEEIYPILIKAVSEYIDENYQSKIEKRV